MCFGKRLFHLSKSVPGLILETLASVGPTHTTDFLRNAVILSFCNIPVYYGAKKAVHQICLESNYSYIHSLGARSFSHQIRGLMGCDENVFQRRVTNY